ncbi:GTP-binding protein [Metabacillus sediminilitoris]|uniref:GTP-binding protein n=1 Tax=Metabacillus sediminilitoris TaxID=2567941 RepID=A0A4S4BU76_9BACI|nr:GTP-binding protein [Metabacillus sediminilitoris]QGQ45012.1 GTP-binding protein [Metabacillus sediminilitoris]THF78644.1 GTP-binding protein [Metabacillus sediminilitoris]
MTTEKQLIHKTYYETYLTGSEQTAPAQVLGQAYFEEQNSDESFDLSYIRFAQGEIYFHYQDYEAAIFKWENIKNELEPWANKNIGDAYYKLGLLSAAEDKYNSIETEDQTLNIEVALKLFFLYQERNKLENAYETIKRALHINSDYPQVTKIARKFYEENNDYKHAVILAVKESIRTEREEWFSILITYVKGGYTKQFEPDFFAEALLTFYEVSQHAFAQLTTALWNSYRDENSYLTWLRTINDMLLTVDHEASDEWDQTVQLYEETFLELTNGSYYLSEIHDVIPYLLANWMKLSTRSNGLFPSATVLAWNEIFPGTVIPDAVYKAESIIFESENEESGLENALHLYHTINRWAEGHSVEVDYKVKWWVEELINPQIKNHFLLTGKAGSGKTTFVNSLLGDKLFKGSTTSFVVLHDDDDLIMNQIKNDEQIPINYQSELNNLMINETNGLFQVKRPCILMHEHQCAIIDTPPINGSNEARNEIFDSLLLVDGMLYVLDGSSPLTEGEYDVLCQIKNFAPNVKVNFILNKVDLVSSDAQTEALINEIKGKLKNIYPEAEILPYSSLHPFNQQLSQLNGFLYTHYPYSMKEKQEKRTKKVLTLIRKMLANLLQKRVEMEKGLIDSIQWNEDILGRLTGFTNKLTDLQQEKIATITAAYKALLKESKTELKVTLPTLIKESSELIKEESDFKQIHIQLNENMNNRVQDYYEQTLIPALCEKLEDWISSSHEELLESQSYLMEMSGTFNEIYQSEKLSLQCEFTILNDWRRDINRMTGRLQYEKENIMLRRNKPTQVILKGAGKLFGGMNQNKSMLANQYKKYVENESYDEVTESISTKLFLPFELFEKGLKQDISTFFNGPINEVTHTITETEEAIQNGKEGLSDMKANPEIFYDPLKLFEVNLLQQEFMLQAKKDYSRSL